MANMTDSAKPPADATRAARPAPPTGPTSPVPEKPPADATRAAPPPPPPPTPPPASVRPRGAREHGDGTRRTHQLDDLECHRPLAGRSSSNHAGGERRGACVS